MNSTRYRRKGIMTLLLAAALLVAVAAPSVVAQTEQSYVSNELILTLQPGSTNVDAERIAAEYGMTVARKMSLQDTYVLKWPAGKADSVESKIDDVRLDDAVFRAYPNYIFHRTAVPNDPEFPKQWHYNMINLPSAWDIEKGSESVIVAVIDDGISTTHPDIVDRLVPGVDIAMGDNDPNYQPGDAYAGHGMHVAGTIAATTDNGLGVAGVCWSGVKIMPVKVFGDNSPWTSFVDVAEGLMWARSNGARVVNLSLGSPFAAPGLQDVINTLTNSGIVVVAAAGNGRGGPYPNVWYPAAFNNVIAVASVGPTGRYAYYSCYGPEVDVAAPGGDMLMGETSGILSTYWEGGLNTYAFLQGTSMASPHVAGVAALMLSNGVRPQDVEPLLKAYATPAGATRPNDDYGWGIIDAYASLNNSGVIRITSPTAGERINTTLPNIQVRLAMVDIDTVKVYLEPGEGIPDESATPIIDAINIAEYYDENSGILQFQLAQRDPANPDKPLPYPIELNNALLREAPLSPGFYRIYITANRSLGGDTVVTGSSTFKVEPRVIPSGLRLISVPSPLPAASADPAIGDDPRALTAEFLGPGDFTMARWLPSFAAYAMLNVEGVISDTRASLFPPDAGVGPSRTGSIASPAGLGFWLKRPTTTSLLLNGIHDLTRSYDISLIAGWNMIGNPFPFNVGWNSAMVTYQGRTRTISDAVALGWLRPTLYRYRTTGYSFESLPAGTMMPWEGHWVRALKGTSTDPVVLSIPPLRSHIVTSGDSFGATKSTSGQSGGKDEWKFKLAVTAGDASDTENVIGTSARASDGYDPSDVETPPMLSRFVNLTFPHRDWGENAGSYTRDMRSPVGVGKTWDFEVETDLENTDVRVTWPDISSVPKDYNLILEDVDSARRVFMRHRSAYTYNSGATPGKRHFKLTVQPAGANRLVLTTVDVTPTKGSNYNISYSVSRDAMVEVRVHSGLRKLVRTLGSQDTRSAGIGSVSWDGRGADGYPVDPGLYLVEIIATDVDGQVAKRAHPLVIRR